ncbi:MAG: hypothetical protein WAN89_02810 [Lawsonella sp.]
MANPQKRKGDRAERDVLAMLRPFFPEATRTRPGRREDEGDILTHHATIQVKDVANAQWKTWIQEWDEQQATSGKPYKILVWKRRGRGKRKPRWLAVMDLNELLEAIHETRR